MAFVVKGQGARVYRSALANAGPDAMSAFQRQRDCYVLALAGSRDCKRLWNDYVAEAPEMARLVVADVQNERRQGVEVSAVLDKRLASAEKLVTKNRSRRSPRRSRRRSPSRRAVITFFPVAGAGSARMPGIRVAGRCCGLSSIPRIRRSALRLRPNCMGGKRARRLAEKMADAHLARVGITKGAGGLQRGQLVEMYLPYATADLEAVEMVEAALKGAVRQMKRHSAEVGRLVDENAVRINRLAETYHAVIGPSVPAARGYQDLDPERFRVGLVDAQAAPKTMNGHGPGPEDGPAPFPPQWRPESSD